MAKGDYSAASYDVIMQQNDAFSEQFILKDSAGDLMSLAGYSFESQVRESATSATVIATMACSVDTETATVTRAMGTAITATVPAGNYVHDMHWIDPSGDVRTLVAGSFVVKADVTRA